MMGEAGEQKEATKQTPPTGKNPEQDCLSKRKKERFFISMLSLQREVRNRRWVRGEYLKACTKRRIFLPSFLSSLLLLLLLLLLQGNGAQMEEGIEWSVSEKRQREERESEFLNKERRGCQVESRVSDPLLLLLLLLLLPLLLLLLLCS
jgi:hypothetical protein